MNISPKSLNDLVKNYGEAIVPALENRVHPVFTDIKNVFDEDEMNILTSLGSDMPLEIITPEGKGLWKGPLPGQQQVIAAVVQAITENRKRLIIRGETGTGKTQISLMSMYMAEKKGISMFPAILMCPRKLIAQWRERIKAILPEEETIVREIYAPQDVELFAALARFRRDKKYMIGLIPFSMISRGPGFRPVYRWVSYPKVDPMKDGEFIIGQSPLMGGNLAIGCPNCNTAMVGIPKEPGSDIKFSWYTSDPLVRALNSGNRQYCPNCGAAFFEEQKAIPDGELERTGKLLYDVGEYIHQNWKRLSVKAKGPMYRTLVTDEMHKMKGVDSLRGVTWRNMMMHAENALGLTATLYGGKASTIRMIYHAFNPDTWSEWGGFKSNRWTDELGNYAEIETYKEDVNQQNNQKSKLQKPPKTSKTKKEIPSANPLLAKMFMPNTAHIRLEHLGVWMPELEFTGVEAPLDPDHKNEYDEFFRTLLARAQIGGNYFAGSFLQNALTYAIAPTMDFHLTGNYSNVKIFPPDYICSPERVMRDFVIDELNDGRKSIVYVTHSDKRDIIERLRWVVEQKGATTTRLPKSLDTEDVPKWLEEEAPKSDILFLNQKAIEGVDAIHFKNVFFYEVDYSVYPVMQAAGRHWRLRQTEKCKTVFMEVPDTMLYIALGLVMQKVGAASQLYGDDLDAMSGKFTANSVLIEAMNQQLKGQVSFDRDAIYAKARQTLVKNVNIIK